MEYEFKIVRKLILNYQAADTLLELSAVEYETLNYKTGTQL